MERARVNGLRFNTDKCTIRCTEIPFFGYIISSSGLRPEPQKVEAISSMHPSTTLANLCCYEIVSQPLSAQPSITLSHPFGPHQE